MPNGRGSSKGPPSYSTTETALAPLSPDSKQTGAVDSSPSWSNTKKSPCQPSTHTTSLLVQAVTTCDAFPLAEHMDLIKCRSLTMISCPHSPNCLCLNPPLHLLLLPLQPEQRCFPTCMFFFFFSYLTTTGQVRTSLQLWGSQHYSLLKAYSSGCYIEGWARFFKLQRWIVFCCHGLPLKIWLTSHYFTWSKPCMLG